MQTYEVNFAYVEDETQKNALVKVRVCSLCAEKLNYKVIMRFLYLFMIPRLSTRKLKIANGAKKGRENLNLEKNTKISISTFLSKKFANGIFNENNL